MSYNVFSIPPFEKQLKRLAKKYPSFKYDGARIITHLKVIESSVYLLSVYDKSEKEDIPNKYIADLLKYIP